MYSTVSSCCLKVFYKSSCIALKKGRLTVELLAKLSIVNSSMFKIYRPTSCFNLDSKESGLDHLKTVYTKELFVAS